MVLISTKAYQRLILVAFGSLCAAAAALCGAPALTTNGTISAALPVLAALLLLAAAAILYTGGRLTTALRTAIDAAARSRSELQVTLNNMSQGLVLCDSGANVVAVNNRFLSLFGISRDRVRPGMTVADLIRLQTEACNMPAEQAEALIRERYSRQPGASGRLEVPFPGGILDVAYQPRPEGGWCCTFEDVTAKKDAERRLAFLAQHDFLTKLPNRSVLHEHIDAAISGGAAFAVMLVDLDGFKPINDTFGHSFGDALLCAVSGRLCAVMRDGDIVARMGGDEFAVLMNAPCARAEADRYAAKLVAAMTEPFQVEGRELRIGASVGATLVSSLPDDGTALNGDVLLHRADLAMYRAKQSGRLTYRFYDSSMEQPVS